MRIIKTTLYILTFLVFISIFMLILRTEAEASEPDAVIYHTLRMENVTFITVNTTVEFNRFEGKNASEIREEYANASESTRNSIIQNITADGSSIVMRMLSEILEGTENLQSETEVNISSLTTNNTTAPIVLTAHSSASLSMETYDLPSSANINDVVTGAFSMGAVIDLPVSLTCPPHAMAYFTIYPLPGTIIEEHTTGIHGQNNVTWSLDNTEDFFSESNEHLRMKSPSASPATEEDIRFTIVLDRMRFNLTTIHVDIEVHSVQVSRYGNLSSTLVSLEYITADGIRMVMENGLTNWSWERVYNESIRSSKQEIEQSISSALNLTISLNFSWDNATLHGYDINTMFSEPPIVASLSSDDITPQLYAIGEERFGIKDLKVALGFLNAGGTAEFTVPAMNIDIGTHSMAKLILSPGMRLKAHSGTESRETDGRYTYFWDPRTVFHGTIYSLEGKVYTDSKIEGDILADLNKIKVNYWNIQQSTIEADISGDLYFYRIKTPSEILKSLPEGIHIGYINADALRLAYDVGLITQKEIDDIIRDKAEEIEKEIRNTFGDDAFFHIEVDDSTLMGYNVEDMKDTPPIQISGIAHLSIPLFGVNNQDDELSASYVLKEFKMDFPVEPIMGWNISYTVLLPKGIVITNLQDDHGLAYSGSRDGREYIAITTSEQEDNITVTIGITPLFLFHLFELPIILITIVGIALYFRHRIKKNDRKKEKKEKMIDEKRLEQEEKHAAKREQKKESLSEEKAITEPLPLTPEPSMFDPWRPSEIKVPETESLRNNNQWNGAERK